MKTNKQKAQESWEAQLAFDATPEGQRQLQERREARRAERIQIGNLLVREAEEKLDAAQKSGFSIVSCQHKLEYAREFLLRAQTDPIV